MYRANRGVTQCVIDEKWLLVLILMKKKFYPSRINPNFYITAYLLNILMFAHALLLIQRHAYCGELYRVLEVLSATQLERTSYRKKDCKAGDEQFRLTRGTWIFERCEMGSEYWR